MVNTEIVGRQVDSEENLKVALNARYYCIVSIMFHFIHIYSNNLFQIAVLLQNLMEDFSFVMKSEYIHFIGHGLGAQMAKPFSEYFVKLTGLAIGRVTGWYRVSFAFT